MSEKLTEYALLSVYNKEGVELIAKKFLDSGMKLLATGNTFKKLREADFEVLEVSELTGEPERFGGRVKTLHHKILGALLLRSKSESDLQEWPFDFRIAAVVCNFYPFEEKRNLKLSDEELIEWVDIGGPNMLRAAAKNYHEVFAFSDPSQYAEFSPGLNEDQAKALRKKLSFEAFQSISQMDSEIAEEFALRNARARELRYGENPHQRAFFVEDASFKKEFVGSLSFNNIRDAEAAFRAIQPFQGLASVVVKHQNPCGAAFSENKNLSEEVFHYAWEGDTTSRFGSVLAFNFLPGPKATEIIRKKFIEVIVLPDGEASRAWAEVLLAKKEKLRFVFIDSTEFGVMKKCKESFRGAFGTLIQEADSADHQEKKNALEFFGDWICASTKSNAIVLCGQKEGVSFLAGSGQGQPNRVEALKVLALPRARDFCERLQLNFSELHCFSDAFLPFRDTVDILADEGLKVLYQPGGSKSDEKVMSAARERDVQMHLTGVRHFWH